MRRTALFARPPEAGRIKTRLAPALTPALTLDLYRAMLADALEAAGSVADEREVRWAEPLAAPLDAGLSTLLKRGGWTERGQTGPDLGARLAHAFGELLRAPGDRAVILGADCPELGAPGIDAAFRELDGADLVLGPTGDGGYYLIGLAHPSPALFSGIDWGTERVLAQTLERAEQTRLAVTLLGRLDDVDRPADVVGLAARELERATRATPAGDAGAGGTGVAGGAPEPGGVAGAPRLGAHTRLALRAFGLLP